MKVTNQTPKNINATRLSFLVALCALPACGAEVDQIDEPTSERSSELVSGALAVTPFSGASASESAALVNKRQVETPIGPVTDIHKVVAFNYDHPGRITYTSTTRRIYSGASGIGWNYASGGGKTSQFTTSPKRLSIPAPILGSYPWPILWGDPGLGQLEGTGYVYMTTLAVPARKMPSVGYIDGAVNDYMGGACVARSNDGGQNFTVDWADCLHTPNFDFYDGSDVTGAGNNNVYAAFRDTVHSKIDVWRATSATGSFAQLPNPFPGIAISGHPRMVRGNPGIYLIASSGANIWIAAHTPTGGWSAPTQIANDYSAPAIAVGGQTVRRNSALGAQYDLAYAPVYTRLPVIYVFYSAMANGHAIIKGSSWDLTNQSLSMGIYKVDPGVHVFHPAITNAVVSQPGAFRSVTAVSWMQQVGNNVAIYSARPAIGMTGVAETGSTIPCPDDRGYWGDYDAHMGVYQPSSSSSPIFWRSFSDSTGGGGAAACTTQWMYFAEKVNVSAVGISRYQ
jgi:hypothetical protein